MLPFFCRWCTRYAAHFPAVGVCAVLATAARVDALFSAVGFRRYAVHFIHVGAAFYPTSKVNAARFAAVGVGVMPPFLLLLVPLFTKPRG